MKKKLSDSELEKLADLLCRATDNEQVSFGLDFDDPKEKFVSRFSVCPRLCGTDGEQVFLGCEFKELAWLWRRVCGARGGAKRKLTTKQARAMAMARHAKQNARPVRTDGPPRDSGTHEAVVGRSEDA